MASGDAYGGNRRWKVEVVTKNAEGTVSGNDQSEATQSNDFNIVQGLLLLVFVCIVCGAYYLALMAADRVSMALTPIPLVIIVHVLYFVIHAIKKCGFTKASTVECTLTFVPRTSSNVASCFIGYFV